MKTIKQKKTLSIIAEIIAIISHPIFVPFLIYSFLVYFSPSFFFNINTTKIGISIFANTLFYPLFALLISKLLGLIKNFQMESKKDRMIPMIFMMTFYFWIFQIALKYPFPIIYTQFLLGVFISLILLVLASGFIKASMHACAWAGVLYYFIVLYFSQPLQNINFIYLFSGIFIIVILSRIYLKKHNWTEIIVGSIIGIISMMMAFYFIKSN